MSEKGLRALESEGALKDDKLRFLEFCEVCVLGKSSKTSFKTTAHNIKGTLDYIHSDM